MLKVQDVMTPGVTAINIGSTVAQAGARMKRENIGWLPILRDGEIVGVISDRDIVTRAIAAGRDPANTPVSDVLSESPVTCRAQHGVKQAALLMQSSKVRRLLVVDEKNEPVGVLSVGDLAASVPDRAIAGKTMAEVCRH